MVKKGTFTKKKKSVQENVSDKKSPTLESLIAEIDKETPRIPGEEYLKRLSIMDKSILGDYGHDQYLKFSLGSMFFMFPLLNALEIGSKLPITQLPNLPVWLNGVSNIRGEIVAIVDLKLFFQIEPKGLPAKNRLIVVHNPKLKIGIIVDNIMGMQPLDEDDESIQEGSIEKGILSEFVKGILQSDNHVFHILDIDRLLSSDRLNQFNFN